jgi:WD40 repeat protein
MLFRISLCVLVFAITAAAQSHRFPPLPSPPPTIVVAVSSDGQTLAVARGSRSAAKRYGRVELWDTQTGELQRTISGFDGPVYSLTFSRDGRTLITASTEYRESKIHASVRDRGSEKVTGELKWWNTQTGEFIKKVSVAAEGVNSIQAAWSPAGDLVAVAERRIEGQLSDVRVPGPFGPEVVMPGYVTFEETELRLLDAETGQRRVKLEDASKVYRGNFGLSFARLDRPIFSPDGAKVAALTAEEVTIWAVNTGKKIVTLKKMSGWPAAIAFSPDSRALAVASMNGRMPGGKSELSVWDVSSGKLLNKLSGRNDSIACLQFVAQGRALLIGSLEYGPDGAKGTVKVWDLRDNRLGRSSINAADIVSSLTHIPEQHAVLMQSGSNVELRDTSTWEIKHSFESTEADKSDTMRRSRFLMTANVALAVAFSDDGTTVSAQIPGEGLRVWDVRTGGLTNKVANTEPADTPSQSAANGGFVAEADDETGEIEIFDAHTKKPIRTIQPAQKVTALSIDPSGRWLAAARADHSIGLWDLKTGTLQSELRKHQDTINALAFSRNGSTLASGGDDRTAILWEVPSGRIKRTLKGHDITVTSLAFSPDGLTLATGSGNAAVVLWNVATGKLDRILH